MKRLAGERDLTEAVHALLAREPRFAAVVVAHGLPSLRSTPPGLESLLRIVTDQLVSRQAAQVIWSRLETRLAPFNPGTVLALSTAELRALGLSNAKARAFHAAAGAFAAGLFGAAEVESLSDTEILSRLTAIPGVGPWTAHVYLLTACSAADAWPAADIALQQAAMNLLSLSARPDCRAMMRLAEGWRPYRSAAALLLWSHYRALKGLPQA